MKKILALIALTFTTIISFNFINLHSSMHDVFKKDARNQGIHIYAHYDYFLNPNVININFWNIDDDKTMADIDRLLFQFAESLKDRSYEKVIFSFRFNKKFFITGEYFKKIGREFSFQNPVYLIRKFPKNYIIWMVIKLFQLGQAMLVSVKKSNRRPQQISPGMVFRRLGKIKGLDVEF